MKISGKLLGPRREVFEDILHDEDAGSDVDRQDKVERVVK